MIIDNNKLEISLNTGKFIIDAEDVSKILSYNWRIFKIGNTSYVKCFEYSSGKPRNTYYLHRLILNLGKEVNNMVVDHIDGNGLNCSKSNLRIIDRGQNCVRSINKQVVSLSGYVGVEKRGNLFYSKIIHEEKAYNLGKFADKDIAAMAYDKAAIRFRGALAVLNLPDLISEHKKLKLRIDL